MYSYIEYSSGNNCFLQKVAEQDIQKESIYVKTKPKVCVSVYIYMGNFIGEKDVEGQVPFCLQCFYMWGMLLGRQGFTSFLQCGLNFLYSETKLTYDEQIITVVKDVFVFHAVFRIGPKEDFFHCLKCNLCLTVNLQGKHKVYNSVCMI